MSGEKMGRGILSGVVALGGSVGGVEPPPDRLTALVDVVSAKTPAGKLQALEAGHRAGHITMAEMRRWLDLPVDDEAMQQAVDGAKPAKPPGYTSGKALREAMGARVTHAQAAAKRRAHNALAGAHARLAGMSAPEWHHADVVATWRDLIGDLSEALERWHHLHTPCDCGPNEACGKCPAGEP